MRIVDLIASFPLTISTHADGMD